MGKKKSLSHRIKSAIFKEPNKVSFKEGVEFHPFIGGIIITYRKARKTIKRKPKKRR